MIGSLNFNSRDASVNDTITGNIGARIESFNENDNGALIGLKIHTFNQTLTNGERLNEVMRLTSGGRVGINSTAPQRRLDVLEPSSQTVAQFRTSGQTKALSRYECVGSNHTPVFVGAAGSDFNIEMGGTDRFSIDENGRVLVGSTFAGVNAEADNFIISANHPTGMTILSW